MGYLPFVAFLSLICAGAPLRAEEGEPLGVKAAALRHGGFAVDLGYEVVRQKGSDDTKYFNFGVGFRF